MINNSSGFTLLEFLIATVILMVGLLGLLQTVNFAMEKNLDSMFRNEAVILAEDLMMQKKGNSFDVMASDAKSGYSRNIRGIQKSYSAAVTVTPIQNSKQIDVVVSWQYKNVPKTHSVSSAVSKIQN